MQHVAHDMGMRCSIDYPQLLIKYLSIIEYSQGRECYCRIIVIVLPMEGYHSSVTFLVLQSCILYLSAFCFSIVALRKTVIMAAQQGFYSNKAVQTLKYQHPLTLTDAALQSGVLVKINVNNSEFLSSEVSCSQKYEDLFPCCSHTVVFDPIFAKTHPDANM